MSDLDEPNISSALNRIVADSDANSFDNVLDPSVFYGDLEGRHTPELPILMRSAPTQRPENVLIRTKLTPPPARVGLVDRPRLLEHLDGALAHRVTLVSAPPGFGKTTLATQWLDQRGLSCAWLSLDSLDGDPDRFARYLVAAVERAAPGHLRESAALLAAQTAPPFDYLCEVLVSELARVETHLTLVLEDDHVVASDDVQRLMERLVLAMPAPVHLLVLTRVDPPWPLGHWRAQGWLLELRASDLRFSLDEARRFFAGGRRPALSETAVGLVHARSEGWVAGLQLIALSLKDSPDPEARARMFSGSDRLVADYLMPEVVVTQSPEIRAFLASTATLPRFCAPLCDYLLAEEGPQPPARETLARLERENLFLVPLDAEGRWFRYHHLFQELLVHHLPELRLPERRAAMDRRAAAWFAREGSIEEALRHWIAAGELDAAADLVGEHLRSVVDEDMSRRRLSSWLELFPAGAERGRLPLLVAHGYLKIQRWDRVGLAELIAESESLLRAQAPGRPTGPGDHLRADVDAQKASLLYWSGDVQASLQSAERALGRPPARGGGITRTMGVFYKAGSLAMNGLKEEALAILEDAVADRGATEGRQIGEFLCAQALIHLYAAELDAVALFARRMRAAHDAAPMPDFWLSFTHYLFGVVAYERNRPDEAAAAFGQVAAMRHRVDTRLYQDALIGLGLVARMEGDAAGVARYAADARAYALEARNPTAFRIADSFDARLALDTEAGFSASPAPPGPDFMSFCLEVPSLTYAEALLRGPSAASEALPFIEQALACVEAHHNARQTIAFSLVRAEALAESGRPAEALEALAKTVRRAEPLGLVRTFVDRGPRLRALLEALATEQGRGGYLGTLLAAFPGGPRPPAGGGEERAVEHGTELSNREIDVLELLAERLSNKEIAERLNVTPETVKTHTRNIYLKLDVHGRRQAVSKAVAERRISPRT